MPTRTTRIELTPDELQAEREAAATKAVRAVLEDEVEPLIDRLNAAVRQVAMMRDLIPEDVLLNWLGISKKTLRQRWEVPHESVKGNTWFYDWATVEEHLREEGQKTKEDGDSRV